MCSSAGNCTNPYCCARAGAAASAAATAPATRIPPSFPMSPPHFAVQLIGEVARYHVGSFAAPASRPSHRGVGSRASVTTTETELAPDLLAGICELTLQTADPGRLERFYVEALGCNVISREDDRTWLACGERTRLGLW